MGFAPFPSSSAHGRCLPLRRGQNQHGGVVAVAQFDIGALNQQQLHDVGLAIEGRGQQGRHAVFVAGVDLGAPADQNAHAFKVAVGGGADEFEFTLAGHHITFENGMNRGTARR